MSAPPLWRSLQFSPETFGPELYALCRQVPALDHLLCRLDAIHDPVYPEDRVLRYYQRDLALHGHFTLHLPYTDIALRSAHSVMLEDKSALFGIEGRPDLLLGAARIGYTLPLCAVVLPRHRTVVNIQGPRWNIDTTSAQRALALFEVAGIDPSTSAPAMLDRAVVTGDANYAHHLWNQLGALQAMLQRCETLHVLATHQPIAPLTVLFEDFPGLAVTPTLAANLPKLDLARTLPFGAAGKLVLRSVRERVLRVAARRASEPVRSFLARAATESTSLIWLTVRAQGRTAVNLFDMLLGLADSLLREENFGIILDGYSRPNDYATNPDYDRRAAESAIAREQALAHALSGELANRLGAAAAARIYNGIGADLLDSIHLAANTHAYFAHHGTLQHKIGYFTKVPGMAHANPGILATDPAGGHRHVTQDAGIVEYIDAALIDDVVAAGSSRGDPNNAYRFKNIPVLVREFRAFLNRQGVRSAA